MEIRVIEEFVGVVVKWVEVWIVVVVKLKVVSDLGWGEWLGIRKDVDMEVGEDEVEGLRRKRVDGVVIVRIVRIMKRIVGVDR